MTTKSNKATKRLCKACKKMTRHSAVADGDKENGIIRCHICGQRPDRPNDYSKIKVTCPYCNKKTTAKYVDDDGMDSMALACCENLIDYAELIEAQTTQHKKDRNNAQILATAIYNANKTNPRLTRISITIGSYTAIVEPK